MTDFGPVYGSHGTFKSRTGISALIVLLLMLTACPDVTAQDLSEGQAGAAGYVYTQEQLDQLLAPIALYPDVLLSQMLMASTYPAEVIEADKWVRANPGLTEARLDEALRDKPWDVSVKSLCRYRGVLRTMAEHPDETISLGNAFLAQQDQVMNTIQMLRRRAYDRGHLRSVSELKLVVEEPYIVLEPASPEIVYVPVYDPCWIYGSWWYPVCSPVWFRYPGVVVSGAFVFGRPIYTGRYGYWCGFRWPRRSIYVDRRYTIGFSRIGATRVLSGPQEWRHNPVHRRGVSYRDPATRQRFGRGPAPGVDERRGYRGFEGTGPAPGVQRVRPIGPGVQSPAPQSPAPRGIQPPRAPAPTPGLRGVSPPGVSPPRIPRSPQPGVRQIQPGQRTPGVREIQPRGTVVPPGDFDTFRGFRSGPEVRRESERGRGSMRSAPPPLRPQPRIQAPGRSAPGGRGVQSSPGAPPTLRPSGPGPRGGPGGGGRSPAGRSGGGRGR
ncbi:MAG: DUF3300 domain-containing protein [Syntrophorhabdaceae bacterium]|nr:DUF3300 domain-containing protein [Syntrophorhabdaceae bacterium]